MKAQLIVELETVQRMIRNTTRYMEIKGNDASQMALAALDQLRRWESALEYWIARKSEDL